MCECGEASDFHVMFRLTGTGMHLKPGRTIHLKSGTFGSNGISIMATSSTGIYIHSAATLAYRKDCDCIFFSSYCQNSDILNPPRFIVSYIVIVIVTTSKCFQIYRFGITQQLKLLCCVRTSVHICVVRLLWFVCIQHKTAQHSTAQHKNYNFTTCKTKIKIKKNKKMQKIR